jgi:hypothetical protein
MEFCHKPKIADRLVYVLHKACRDLAINASAHHDLDVKPIRGAKLDSKLIPLFGRDFAAQPDDYGTGRGWRNRFNAGAIRRFRWDDERAFAS